jgi:hypothetical protein
MIAFPCRKCGNIVQVPGDKVGTSVKCSLCGTCVYVQAVPVASPAAQPPIRPAPPAPPPITALPPSAIVQPPPASPAPAVVNDAAPSVPPPVPRRRFLLWVPALLGCAVILVVFCGAGTGVGLLWWTNAVGRLEDEVADTIASPPPKSEIPSEKRPELRVIFKHSPKKSVAKLIRRDSPTPPGWQGGSGRQLSAEYYQREFQLSAVLSEGKEGETSSITAMR